MLRISPSLGWLSVGALAVAVGVLGATTMRHTNVHDDIASAAKAPYVDFARKRAGDLCADFTPVVDRSLGTSISPSKTCSHRMNVTFAAASPSEVQAAQILLRTLKVTETTASGDNAGATLAYKRGKSTLDMHVSLEKVQGRWRVVTVPSIALVKGCFVHGVVSAHCTPKARIVLFSIGVTREHSGKVMGISVPVDVEHAGGQELYEFKLGNNVAIRSGCLACHRLGRQGKRGPGPDLTHVGSHLTEAAIAHSLISPTTPMPSFRGLPAKKFRALVQFLALLK